MWTAISFIGGSILAAISLLLQRYFSNAKATARLEDISKVAADRLTTVEEQAQLDRAKRLREVNDEITKINSTSDGAAALELLRKQFPGSASTITSSQMQLPHVP